MSPLGNVLQIIGRPPGSLAYHVIILFALEAMAGMAWEEWRRMRRQEYKRASIGFLSLLGLQLVWILLSTLGWRGWLDGQIMAWLWPPLNDLFWTIACGALLWALAPLLTGASDEERNEWGSLAGLAALLIFAVVALLFWRAQWLMAPDAPYGQHWTAWVWMLLRLAILSLGAYWAWFRATEQRTWQRFAWSLMAAGQLGQLIASQLTTISAASGWLRIAEIMAYPVLAMAVHQSIVADLYSYGQEFKTVSEESLRQTRELLFLLETSKATTSTLDLDDVMDSIVENVVMALNADQCAIAFASQQQADHLQIMATYDPLHGDRFAQLANRETKRDIDLSAFPLIGHALERRQQVISNQMENEGVTQELFQMMGSNDAGPLIVQPLVSNDTTLGALLVGNARSKRPFSQSDGKLCQALAGQVATAMENARLYQDVEAQALRLQQMLRSQELEGSQSRTILESIANGVIVTDADNKITAANRSAERILGRSRQSLLRQDIYEFYPNVPPPVRNGEITLLQLLEQQENGISLELVSSIDDRIFSASLAPITDNSGGFVGVVAVFQDVTKELQAERAKSDFVATVSHELRTPLTSIQGYADLLLQETVGELNDTQRRFLDKTRYNTRRMVEMVNDLIDVSEIGPLGVQIQPEPINISELIAQATVAVQEQIEERKLTIDFDLQEGLPEIMGDPKRLGQVVVNLLDNACKYTPAEGRVQVRTRWRQDAQADLGTDAYLLLEVADSGVGIPEEEQARIFERFYRAENPLSLEAGGAGLGLTLAKAIVQAHGGRIWVESEPEQGSTFYVALPAIQTDASIETTGVEG